MVGDCSTYICILKLQDRFCERNIKELPRCRILVKSGSVQRTSLRFPSATRNCLPRPPQVTRLAVKCLRECLKGSQKSCGTFARSLVEKKYKLSTLVSAKDMTRCWGIDSAACFLNVLVLESSATT
eukprot:141681-Amphidinium_carterae.1